ncbi:MAG: transposase [Rhodospirillales bacterium]|nr:transposase [Rhodospirillales bacterium]
MQHSVRALVTQRVVGIALGYEDLIDHNEPRHNPVLAGKLSAGRAACAPLAGLCVRPGAQCAAGGRDRGRVAGGLRRGGSDRQGGMEPGRGQRALHRHLAGAGRGRGNGGGEMENRIKECQLDLVADRTSSATTRANQLRLWVSSLAYALMCALRRIGLAETHFANATCGTIRLKPLKIGALVRISVRRVSIAMASACLWQAAFAPAHAALRRAAA